MLLLLILAASALLSLLLLRIAASPPFPLLACLFQSWAERCRESRACQPGWADEHDSGPELPG